MLARDVLNQIAYQYLIPTLQVGSEVVVQRSTGGVLDFFGVIRSLGTTAGCLRRKDLITLINLAEEAVADEQQRKNQRYVEEPGVAARA